MKAILRNKKVLVKAVVLILLVFFNKCSNRYERDLIGKYRVADFEKIDTLNKDKIASCTLSLSINKTFSLILPHREVIGVWKANDNGDFTWIEFSLSNKRRLTEGRIGDSIIIINTPANFFYPNLKTLVFRRISQ